MHSSLFPSMTRAGLALLVSSFLLPAGAEAAPIREVSVSVTGAGGMPPAVEKRITASISAIGNRILVGKDESLFRSHESEYDKVLATAWSWAMWWMIYLPLMEKRQRFMYRSLPSGR